jgi:hypothetical protein
MREAGEKNYESVIHVENEELTRKKCGLVSELIAIPEVMIKEKKINTIFSNPNLTDGGDKIVASKGVIFTNKIGLLIKAARDRGPPATLLNVSARKVFVRQVTFCLVLRPTLM